MNQGAAFLDGEAAAWFERNKYFADPESDPILRLLEDSGLKPSRVLEVGCSNGWRLAAIRARYGCRTDGIDPLKTSNEYVYRGTADDLGLWYVGTFDLVIYGFCLYLVDREDLFRIVTEGDRVLKDGGHLIIWDFSSKVPHCRPYKHREGLFSYKMDYANLWLANPAYSLVRRSIQGDKPDNLTSVVMLQKRIDRAWPVYE